MLNRVRAFLHWHPAISGALQAAVCLIPVLLAVAWCDGIAKYGEGPGLSQKATAQVFLIALLVTVLGRK